MKTPLWLGFTIDRSGATPVFEQICAAIRARAISGELQAGSRLPATRVFASELGVSRATVVTAYDQLIAEGYLTSRPGSGYQLCAMGEVELARAPQPAPPLSPHRSVPVPFDVGELDMRLFPHRQWAKTVARVCRNTPEAMLTGGGLFGNPALQAAIASHVADWRGIKARPEQVIVTAGAADALELCARTLANTGERIALEDPCYPQLPALLQARGAQTVFLPVDGQGATLPPAGSGARLAVLTPSHQYPLGGVLSPSRRMAFLQWAAQNDAWVVEDDYDSEFRFAGRPIPAMAGLDRLHRTLYIGSFSKIFSSSMRLGYLIVPEDLIAPFRKTIYTFSPRASLLPQQALADYITSGEFYRHLRRVRRIYAERRKALLARLAEDFADFGSVTDHQAGMQVVFHLKPGWKDTDLVARAAASGLLIEALSDHGAQVEGLNGLMLGYCAFTEDELTTALQALRALFI